MLSERRDPPGERLSRLFGELGRLAPKQSQFSSVSAALAAALLVSMTIDYFVGHKAFDRTGVALWILFFLVLAATPLAMGRRFPRWMGLLQLALLTFWAAYSLFFARHSHMEIDALLVSPVLGVYLGWFYRIWTARLALVLHLLAISAASLLRPNGDSFPFSSGIALAYAILISALCLETAAAVRAGAERESWRDPLTHVLNRRGLVALGGQAIARAQSTGEPLSLAVVDFDDFKTVNDTSGHAEGDRALRVVSAGWVNGLQPHDLVARTGGDEFVLVFHEDETAARDRLKRLAAASEFSWSWGLVRVSASDTFDEAVKRADIELYAQKRRRREG